MSISALNAAADLRALKHVDLLQLSFAALLQAPAHDHHDVAAWRSLSNLIGAEWMEHTGLRSPTAWWAPRRSDARALAGRRTMSTTSSSSGGDLAIGSAVTAIASATRPRLVLEAMGAIRNELPGRVVDAVSPSWAGGSGYWVAEGADVGDASLTVTSASASPRTAGATITLSRRLVQQADSIEQSLAREIQTTVKGTIEAAFITGDGTQNKPLGLLLTPGATPVAFAGALPTYAEIKAMVKGYYDADGNPDAARFIVNPETFADLLTTTEAAGTGQYAATINGGRQILGIPAALSNHVPAGRAILLDPGNVETFYWRSPQVIVNRYIDNDFSGATRLTVLNDCAMLVQHRPQLIIGG